MLGLLHLSPHLLLWLLSRHRALLEPAGKADVIPPPSWNCVFSPKVPLPPNGQMPGFGLLPTPQFPPMAQPVMPPAAPVQPTFQSPFPVQAEAHLQKPHQQVSEQPLQWTDRLKCSHTCISQMCVHCPGAAMSGWPGHSWLWGWLCWETVGELQDLPLSCLQHIWGLK